MSDRSAPDAPKPLAHCDVIIDLAGSNTIGAKGPRQLRVLYDGSADQSIALSTLLSDRSPQLDIEDVATGTIAASGLPSLEASTGLTGRLDSVLSRLIMLLVQAVASPRSTSTTAARPSGTRRGPAAFFVRGLARQALRTVQNLAVRSPHWRIGWRFNDGPGVIDHGSLEGPPWSVLPIAGDAFGADPFPVEWQGRRCIFYERFDYDTGKGTIWVQELGDDGPIGHARPALEERWHLSYPFLLEHGGELYMVPEAARSGAVTLYRCVGFPNRWEPVQKLLQISAADSTLFRHGGRHWMTSVIRPGIGGYSDTLIIHHASDLLGPWEPHALQPALIDARFARPAGRVVPRGGSVWRPTQDCSMTYGGRVMLMRVRTLDLTRFEQEPAGVIEPGSMWPGKRLHTVNRWGRLECIDGAVAAPRNPAIRQAVNALWA